MVWKSQQIGPPRSSNCTKTNSVETLGLDNFLVLLKNDLSTKLEVVLRQQQINTKNGNEPKKLKTHPQEMPHRGDSTQNSIRQSSPHVPTRTHTLIQEGHRGDSTKILSANHRHKYQLERRL
jgi:hypothetical protein